MENEKDNFFDPTVVQKAQENLFQINLSINYVEKDQIYLEMEKDIICPVCKDIFKDPFTCFECQSSFCKKCLEEKCLNKCIKGCEKGTFFSDKKLNKILEKISYKCIQGCLKSFRANDLKEHLRTCVGKILDNKFLDNDLQGQSKTKRIEDKTLISKRNIPNKKIILVGESAVGKTSLFNAFIHGKSEQSYPPTVGHDYNNVTYQLSDGTIMVFHIWDTAGQERFRAIIPQYFADISGCIFMYDITKKDTFPDDNNYFLELIKEKYPKQMPPTILVGNKSDLENERQVSQEEGVAFAAKNNFLFQETSVINNSKIKNVFEELFELINMEHKKKKDKKVEPSFHVKKTKKKEETRECCS